MIKKWRPFFREVFLRLARLLGSEIVDAQTGRPLGRAFLFCWRGRVSIIGLEGTVKPIFVPQERLVYWKQELGFTVHPAPDFAHEPRP